MTWNSRDFSPLSSRVQFITETGSVPFTEINVCGLVRAGRQSQCQIPRTRCGEMQDRTVTRGRTTRSRQLYKARPPSGQFCGAVIGHQLFADSGDALYCPGQVVNPGLVAGVARVSVAQLLYWASKHLTCAPYAAQQVTRGRQVWFWFVIGRASEASEIILHRDNENKGILSVTRDSDQTL